MAVADTLAHLARSPPQVVAANGHADVPTRVAHWIHRNKDLQGSLHQGVSIKAKDAVLIAAHLR